MRVSWLFSADGEPLLQLPNTIENEARKKAALT